MEVFQYDKKNAWNFKKQTTTTVAPASQPWFCQYKAREGIRALSRANITFEGGLIRAWPGNNLRLQGPYRVLVGGLWGHSRKEHGPHVMPPIE